MRSILIVGAKGFVDDKLCCKLLQLGFDICEVTINIPKEALGGLIDKLDYCFRLAGGVWPKADVSDFSR